MQLLQNTPISCRTCGQYTAGRETPVRRNDGSLVMECSWRCQKCGTFLKTGTTKIIEPARK